MNRKILLICKVIFFTLLYCSNCFPQQVITRFFAIGDYGLDGPNEKAVAELVAGWDTSSSGIDTSFFGITLGDNNYELGEQQTIQYNIGKYWSNFIYPYNISGFAPAFPKKDNWQTTNRFYPSIGNHDLYTDPRYAHYLYFRLNDVKKLNDGIGVRYYHFRKGNIEFFSVNTATGNEYFRGETDGYDMNSKQYQRVSEAIRNSDAKFKIVFMHYPPYCSWCDEPSNKLFRWNFKELGVDLVMAGHAHFYERIYVDSVWLTINGAGGHSVGGTFEPRHPGSVSRYGENFGAQLLTSYNDSLNIRFVNINKEVIDSFTILKPD